jgi:hypothetical protein
MWARSAQKRKAALVVAGNGIGRGVVFVVLPVAVLATVAALPVEVLAPVT